MLRNLVSLSVLLILIPAVENTGLFGNFLSGVSKGGLGLGAGLGLGGSLNLGGSGLFSGNYLGGLSAAIDKAIGNKGCSSYPCQHTCTDTSNGYTCACNPGFRVSASNSNDCEAISICIVKPDGSLAVKPPAVVVNPPVSVPSTGVADVVKPCIGGVKVDLVLVIDSSGSIGERNYHLNFEFLLKFLASLTIGPADVRVGAYIFSSSVKKLFSLSDNLDQAGIARKFDKAPFLNGKTYTWNALDALHDDKCFDQKNGGRPEALKVVLLVTDGKSQDTYQTILAATVLKNSENAIIVAIPIGKDCDREEIEGVASSKDDIINVESYVDLPLRAGRVAQRFCNLKLGLGAAVKVGIKG